MNNVIRKRCEEPAARCATCYFIHFLHRSRRVQGNVFKLLQSAQILAQRCHYNRCNHIKYPPLEFHRKLYNRTQQDYRKSPINNNLNHNYYEYLKINSTRSDMDKIQRERKINAFFRFFDDNRQHISPELRITT
jgi:hypothetical protein